MKKSISIIAALGLTTIAIGYYLWFSPILMLLGAIILISDIIASIYLFLSKTPEGVENIGCLTALIFAVILCTAFFMGNEYIIFNYGGKRHLYVDCSHKESCESHEVGKLSSIIWGCYEDCSYCTARKKKEIERKFKEYKEKKKKDDLNFINVQIEELTKVRSALLRGEDIDVDDYEFKKDVEDEIRESAIDEYRNADYEPRGRR